MAHTHEINDIPTSSKADEIVAEFENDGCTAQKEQQDNGLWLVKATCP